MNKKRVCIIYTGGTIGMVWVNETLKPPVDPTPFREKVPEIYELADIEWEFFKPALDSTNMTPKNWTAMARAIHDRMSTNPGFDAYVIVHGTDTMHFSASALAFAFGQELNVPIVFTGAQTDMSILHGDARINLIRAVQVALEPLAEVVIVFGNHVFRGCRTQKKDEKRFDAFESPAYYPIGDITEKIILHSTAKLQQPENAEINFQPDFDANILQLSLIPGLRPKLLMPLVSSRVFDGIVLQSFGAGNVPNIEEYSFMELIQEAEIQHTPVVITSQFPANSTLETNYEPGKDAIKNGAIPTGNMTNACAIAKFYWILNKVNSRISKGELAQDSRISQVSSMMQRPYIWEFDPPRPKRPKAV